MFFNKVKVARHSVPVGEGLGLGVKVFPPPAGNGADNQRRRSLLGLWSETESRIFKKHDLLH
jgi:hypothetical protein